MRHILPAALIAAAVLAHSAYGQSAGPEILSPGGDISLDAPAAAVVLRFPAGSPVTLRVNGTPVSPTLIGRTETDAAAQTVTQTWYGVVLKEGANVLVAETEPGGARAERTVEVQTAPRRLTLRALGARLPADGRSTLAVTGALLDAQGRLSHHDGLVTLTAGSGEWVGEDEGPDQPGFQVRTVGGQFRATLRAGVRAQTVRVRALAGDLEAFTTVEFTTDLRPSLATGVVDVRLGSRRSDYDRPIQDFISPDVSDIARLHGRTSVFATGKVGDYLFTGAYDSEHALNQTASGPSSLGRDTQTRDQPYPVYGDSSTAYALAQSRDNLALRLERDQNYLLWGDYGTAEFAGRSQEFTAITRSFHALKANYQFGGVQATGFYGDNVQGFQRDTVAPDGTSGLYFLSHRPLVYGSESVFLELEDLNRPGTVLSRAAPQRGADYEIDYDRGTLLFHQPVLRTDVGPDGQALVRRIVVTYQYETGGSGTNVYGGRAQYGAASGPRGLLGVTFLRQNQGLQGFDLYGADAALPLLGGRGMLIAEVARSSNRSTGDGTGSIAGSAYRVSAEASPARGVQVTAYLHAAGTGFSNDATTSFVPGQARYGGEVVTSLSPTTRLRLSADHEDNKGVAPVPAATLGGVLDPGSAPAAGTPVDNSLQTYAVTVQQHLRRAELSVGVTSRRRTDRMAGSGLSGSSNQLETRLTAPVTKNISLLAQNDTTLSPGTDAVYTDRTSLGADWKARPGVDVRLTEQLFGRGQYSGHAVTSLETVAEHKGTDGTQMSERFALTGGASGISLEQSFGLGRRWTLAPGLGINLAYEHVNGAFFGRTAAGSRFAQPYAVGQSASGLGVGGGGSMSAGLEYTRSRNFKASARYETRDSAGGGNTVITGALAGKVGRALTALGAYQSASSSNQTLEALGRSVTLRMGLAYRDPARDTVNFLLRYDYRRNPSETPDTILIGSGTGSRDGVFAAEAIYAPQWQWEFYGKLARRDSVSYLAGDYVGGSRIDLAQARATYRFRADMDLVGDVRWIGQPTAGYSSRGLVVEAGYYATPDLRLSAGYSFGRVGDRDFSGARSAGGIYLGFTAKVNQLFSGFGLERGALADKGRAVPAGYAPAPTGNAAGPSQPPSPTSSTPGRAGD